MPESPNHLFLIKRDLVEGKKVCAFFISSAHLVLGRGKVNLLIELFGFDCLLPVETKAVAATTQAKSTLDGNWHATHISMRDIKQC